MRNILFISFSIAILLLSACGKEVNHPRPRCYPKIDFPANTYKPFAVEYCNFSFEQPEYMVYSRDTSFFKEKPKHPCWFNLEIPNFNATIHFTYTPVHNKDEVYEVFKDAYELASKHDGLADANNDFSFNRPDRKVYGVLYDIEGSVATPFQFTLTDSLKHSVHAALYFNCPPEPDSLMPMVNFVKRDMMQMLNTFEWKN